MNKAIDMSTDQQNVYAAEEAIPLIGVRVNHFVSSLNRHRSHSSANRAADRAFAVSTSVLFMLRSPSSATGLSLYETTKPNLGLVLLER